MLLEELLAILIAGRQVRGWVDSTAQSPVGGNLTTSQQYLLTLTDASGCMAFDTVWVMVNGSISVVASAADSLICYGQSTSLMATANGGSGAFSYFWGSPIGISGANVSSGILLADQQFVVTVTDSVGCTATDDVTVLVSPFFAANAGPDQGLCLGDSLVLGAMPTQAGGIPPYTCSWDSAGGAWATACNPVITGITQPTPFVLTVTDSAGCTATDSVTIIAAPQMSVNAGADTLVCFGDSLLLNAVISGGIAPFTFQWASSQTINNPALASALLPSLTASAWVSVLITDSLGCQAIDSFFVTVNPQLVANAGSDTLVCFQDSFQLAGSAVGGDGSYVYQWSPANNLLHPTIANPRGGNLSAPQTYTLLVTDGNGCPATDSMQVLVNPQLLADAGSDTLVCFRDSFQLLGNALGGTAGYSYSWSPGAGLVDSTAQNPIGGNLTASQQYLLTLTDASGCMAFDTVWVMVNGSISVVASAADSLICYGQSTSLMATANGGSGAFSYFWGPPIGISGANVSSGILLADQQFVVTVTDSVGCTATDDVTVLVSPFFAANAGPDQGLCLGDSLVLGAMPTQAGGIPPYACSWDSAGVAWATACNPVITGITQSTPFVLTVTDSAGCTATDSVTIIAAPQISVNAGQDTLVCFGDSLLLNAVISGGIAPFTFQWASSQTINNPALASALLPSLTASAWVSVLITDSLGCQAIDSFFVTVNPQLVANAGSDTLVCFQDSFQLAGSAVGGDGSYVYQWSPANNLLQSTIANPRGGNLSG